MPDDLDTTKTRTGNSTDTCHCGPAGDDAARLTSNLGQVAEVQKLKSLGLIAGGIAHDFNNILTGVLGNADLALADLDDRSPGREHLIGIQRAARRAADLARELLAYSGQARFVVEPLDLSVLIDETKQLIHVSLIRKPVIEYDLPVGLGAVEADRTQLRQLLLNLVINGSEALAATEGVIKVRTGSCGCDAQYLAETRSKVELEPGRYSYFEVTDNGAGMDDETREKALQPFYSTKGTGRGLGLAAALDIVSGHGGGIRIDSKPGRGTTIRILLPPSGKAVAQASSADQAEEAWQGSGTVLLIDDEPAVRMVASSMLEMMGLQVVTAADGKEGLETFRCFASDVNLILADRTMPRMSGLEMVQEIRAIDPTVRVVLMSGYSADVMRRRHAGLGITHYLEKPFDFTRLREVMRAALETAAESPPVPPFARIAESESVGLRRDLGTYRKLAGEIKLAHYDTARRLARAAEERSGKLAGRLERISYLAAELARELGISDQAVQVLAAAAPFHDIGQLDLPDDLLHKSAPLFESEWKVVRSHCEKGCDLLTGLCSRIFEAGAEIALSHHERWDGTGYPFGLSGTDIPLFGRIVGLVDQYDALRSWRPYRPALSHERVCKILLEGDERTKPGHFDPDVLAAFANAEDRFESIFDNSGSPYYEPADRMMQSPLN